MTPDPSQVERISSWRDEHLDCICGLANGRGGVVEIGREIRREAIEVTDLLRLADLRRSARKQPENRDQPENRQKVGDRILAFLRKNPSASRREIAATLGATRSTVRYRLDRLREAGKIERVGPDKGGHWSVLDESATEAGR